MKKFRIKFNSIGTLIVMWLCVAAYVLNVVTFGRANSVVFSTYRSSLVSPLTWLRFVTHSFGHANINHLLSNLTLFLLVSPVVESRVGIRRYFSVVVGSSMFIGVTHTLLFPNVALCGLSGVVFTMLVLSSFCNDRDGYTIPMTVILVILLWIGREMYSAVTNIDNVSQFSHLLGGLYGFVYGLKKDTST